MFYKCDSLKYLNLYSFIYENKSQVIIDDLFYFVPNNTIYCIKDNDTKNYFSSKNKILDCIDLSYNSDYNKDSYILYSNDTSKNIILIIVDNNTNISNLIFDNILSNYQAGEGKDIVIKGTENNVYQVTSQKNELELLKNRSNNIHNLSIVDLGECESILKTNYNLKENDSLIFIKSETISDKASKKSVNYEVYEPYNKTKLNLSICDETSINLYIPMELSDKNKIFMNK